MILWWKLGNGEPSNFMDMSGSWDLDQCKVQQWWQVPDEWRRHQEHYILLYPRIMIQTPHTLWILSQVSVAKSTGLQTQSFTTSSWSHFTEIWSVPCIWHYNLASRSNPIWEWTTSPSDDSLQWRWDRQVQGYSNSHGDIWSKRSQVHACTICLHWSCCLAYWWENDIYTCIPFHDKWWQPQWWIQG